MGYKLSLGKFGNQIAQSCHGCGSCGLLLTLCLREGAVLATPSCNIFCSLMKTTIFLEHNGE